jgi:hypothetical protein
MQVNEQERSLLSPASFAEFDERGVDVSLLRWILRLSPLERLKLMEQQADETRRLNEYGRRGRQTAAGPNR